MCGIVAMVQKDHVNQLLYDALLLLQHRGQDAAGIATQMDRKFFMYKAKGMVRDVFRTRNMRALPGNCGLGQVRYPTAGNAYSEEEAIRVEFFGDEVESISKREYLTNNKSKDLDEVIMGKNVLVIEDIIDSGLTLKRVLKILGNRGPKSISLCTLLNKEARREADVDVQFVGFNIADEFVLGYGLDFKQEYRNLPYIGVMGPISE